MGKLSGFMEYKRVDESYDTVENRLKNYKEFTIPLDENTIKNQGARCMDCGIPFCHSGCPLGNLIPDFNDYVYLGNWEKAAKILHSTNNFPEFTGRLCPAPCEQACVLGINADPVSIENIEKNIVEIAFDKGWIKAHKPEIRTGKTIAVVGSGPSGLAAAQQLNRAGHLVTVFERDSKIGGLLRYGIPDFKLEKQVIDRRVEVLEQEGIVFKTNTNVGEDVSVETLRSDFDVILLCGGATAKRSLPIKGADLKGVVQAMDFLKLNNEYVDGLKNFKEVISAKDKNVVVIGGGDTGSDCIGTSFRQGAKKVTQLEIMPMPPKKENKELTWPYWPHKLRTSSSQEEGAVRDWSVMTKSFETANGKVKGLKCIKLDASLKPIKNSEFFIKADLVLLAMGFVHPKHDGLLDQSKLEKDEKGNLLANNKNYLTSEKSIYAAGDARRGQSLVVWAIKEGREAASAIHDHLSS